MSFDTGLALRVHSRSSDSPVVAQSVGTVNTPLAPRVYPRRHYGLCSLLWK